jgi:HK97 family phage prohead protease
MANQALAVDVVRAVTEVPEVRAAAQPDDGIGLLSGHFSKFDNWYRIASVWEGEFLERTAPGFTLQTIAEDRAGMRVLFNHGFDGQIADKVLGPIRDVREDADGVYYEVPLFDTTYNRDLLPGLKAGVYGASFRMRVLADSWDDEPARSEFNPNGIPERTITRAQVMEFGPVTFPANPEASAGVRSGTDEFYETLRHRDKGAFDQAVRAAGIQHPRVPAQSLDFTGRIGARSAVDGGTEATAGNAKASTLPTHRRAQHMALRMKGIV